MRRLHHVATRYALVVLAAVFLAGPSAAQTTGDITTFDIELHEGKNLVSLPVLPGTSEIDQVLASVFDQVEWIKDDRDAFFIPEHVQDFPPVARISTWQWDTAYEVKMTEAATLSVEGPLILPNSSAISLEAEVQNRIPFWGEQELPVAQAFAPIADRLVEVKDDQGRWYLPGDANSTLDVLRPGDAYLVRVSDPTVLVYPPLPGSEGGVLQTNTLAETLAIPNLQVGQEINVLGYYTPGDGGGGLFSVQTAPAVYEMVGDGGTIFIPEVAAGPVETQNGTKWPGSGVAIEHEIFTPVVFGSVAYTVSTTDLGGNPWTITLTDDVLHGANYTGHQPERAPYLKHDTGRIRVHTSSNYQQFLARTGTKDHDYSVAYRPITGTTRLVRDTTGSNGVWNARWFGCRAHDEAPYFNNASCFNWANLAVERVNAATPRAVKALHFSDNDDDGMEEVFYYIGGMALAKNIELWGDRGAEVVDSTDAYGNDFSFVRARSDATVLRVLPESASGCTDCRQALLVELATNDYNTGSHAEATPDVFTGGGPTTMTYWEGSAYNALRRIVLDGNDDEQEAFWDSPYSSDNREGQLRNSPGYTGFNAGNHNGKVTQDHEMTFEDVQISDYPATGYLVNEDAGTTTFRRFAIGNASYNHATYLYNFADAEDFTLFGYSWGNPLRAGDFRRLTLLDVYNAPRRHGAEGSFGIRAYNVPTCANASLPKNCGLTVDGYYFDAREPTRVWGGIGPEMTFKNGVVVQRGDYGASLFAEGHNGFTHGRYNDVGIDGMALYHEGEDEPPSASMKFRGAHHQSYIRNVWKELDGNGTGDDFGSILDNGGLKTEEGAAGAIYEFVFDRIGVAPDGTIEPIDALHLMGGQETPLGWTERVFFRDFYADIGRGSTPIRNNYVVLDYELYFRDSEFGTGSGYYGDGEPFFNIARFENVTSTQGGHTSEDSGSATCDGSTTLDIPTNLLWQPHATRGEFAVTGGPAVASVTYDTEGQNNKRAPTATVTFAAPCANGITVNWSGAVSRWLDANGAPVLFPSEANGGWYPYE